jgi:hypothetical protein
VGLAVISLAALIVFNVTKHAKVAAAANESAHRGRRSSIGSGLRHAQLATTVAIIFAVALVLPVCDVAASSVSRRKDRGPRRRCRLLTRSRTTGDCSATASGGSFLQQLHDVGDCGGGGVVVELLHRHVVATATGNVASSW